MSMFKKLIAKLKTMTEPKVVNPAQFNDPVAMKTEWTPAKGGGTNICTRKLFDDDSGRVEFRPTRGALFFYLLFLLIGMGMLIGFAIYIILSWPAVDGLAVLIPAVLGGVFTTAGGLMYYFGTQPIVFDINHNYFWKSRKSPRQVFDINQSKGHIKIEMIHALQIISEYCSGDKSSFYSYELNLVLKDGSRVNVVDHGNLRQLRSDTAQLSQFIDKPVWDAVDKST